jgi:hypothetical protein
MVPWWKRLIYSLVSVTLAAFIGDAFFTIGEVFAFPSQHFEASGFLPGLVFVFLFSLPGWVLSIPVVLIVTNVRGWRFWMYLVIGCSIGPLLMFGIALYGFLTDPRTDGFAAGASPLLFLGTAVSCLTTLIYLLLLRRAHTVEAKKSIALESGLENPQL